MLVVFMEVLSSFDVHLMWKLSCFILLLQWDRIISNFKYTGYEWHVLQVMHLPLLTVASSAVAFLLPYLPAT